MRPSEPFSVRHPEVPGAMVTLNPGQDYDADDVLVKAYPWAFEEKDQTPVTSVAVEQATAAPGEKRSIRRK